MTVYHIEFAKLGHSITGGEDCMIELIKFFETLKYKNVLLTTDNGRYTYNKHIPENELLEIRTINSYKEEKRFGAMISYILRTLDAIKLVKQLNLESDDILICHSEFLPNSIPSWVLNRRFTDIKSANFFHMKAPGLFRGYLGEFTGKFSLPSPSLIHYRLNQWLYRQLTYPRTVILTVNPYYKEFLNDKYPMNQITVLKSYRAVDTSKVKERSKKYDAIWVGRFHAQKGIDDLLSVIEILVKRKPDIKIAILGGEPEAGKQIFEQKLKDRGLLMSVELPGFVSGDRKFEYFAQSRVFIMPSYYESFGGVILEAMACGVPVVAYDLPVYAVFRDGIVKVPALDYEQMAKRVLEILNKRQKYNELKIKGQVISAEHSWEKTGREILDALEPSHEFLGRTKVQKLSTKG